MSTIKISQLGNVATITGNVLIPMVANVDGTLTTLKSNVTSLQTYVLGNIENDLANASSNITTLQGNVTSIDSSISALSGNVSTLQGNVTSIDSSISALSGNVSTLQGNVTSIEGNVSTLQGNVTSIEGNVSTLQGNVTSIEGNVSTLQGNVTAIEDDLLDITDGTATFGNIVPSADETYNLGSSTAAWKDLYLSGSTIYLGGVELSAVDGNLTISTPISVSDGFLSNLTVTSTATFEQGILLPLGSQISESEFSEYNSLLLLSPDGGSTVLVASNDSELVFNSIEISTEQANIVVYDSGNALTRTWQFTDDGAVVFPDGTKQFTANAGEGGSGADITGTVYGTDNLANVTTGYDNVVLGNLNLPTLTEGFQNTVIGINNAEGLVDGGQNVFVGYNNFVSNHATLAQTVIIGTNNTCNADQGVFIGASITVEDPTYIYSVGIGNAVDIYGRQAVAIGDQAAAAEFGTAVGTFSYAGTYLSTALGKDTYVLSDSEGSMAVGLNAGVWNNCLSSMAIGESATVYDDSNSAIVIGTLAFSGKNNSIAIGAGAYTDVDGNLAIAIGKDSVGTGHSAIAIGTEAIGSAANCIAIGNGATCGGNDESIAIGTGVDTDFSYQFKLGTPDHTVTIPGGFMVYSLEDPSSGTPTINQTAGRVTISSGQTSKVVNNNLVSIESHVFAVVAENDATAYVKNVVPGNGSFTINLGAATTADTKVSFFVVQAFDVAV